MGEIIQEKVKDKLIIPVITTALISIIDPLSGLVSGIGYTSCWDAKNLATECIHTWPADAL